MRRLFFFLSTLTIVLSASAQKVDSTMVRYGMDFLGTPYVAHTLEVNEEEQLVVNLKEVDCTTFVEYVLAFTLSSSARTSTAERDNGNIDEQTSESRFRKALQQIRYRNGKIEGYPSRLHYIADWVNNGTRHGWMEDVAAFHSPDTVTLALNFMTTHSKLYRQLASSPENIKKMREIEQSLSGQSFHYIPKEKLPDSGFPWIQSGDVIAITTNIPGLDVVHLGIAYYADGQLKLLHASSSGKKVMITQGSLAQMLKNNKSHTGIRVLRAKTI